MIRKKLLIMATCFMILGLLLAGCAPAVAPSPTPIAAPPAKTPAAVTPASKPAIPTPVPKPRAEQPRYGGILTVRGNGVPPSFDIHQESTMYTIQPAAPSYNALVKYDPFRAEIVGDLAQRWEVSEAGKVYTFYLNKGVKWHDGQTASTEDVKFSLDRIRRPPRGTVSPRQAMLSAIEDVEVVNQDAVRVVLRYPYAGLLGALSTGWEVIMPKHVIESRGDMKRVVVGTGPFRFTSYEPGSFVKLERNKDYFLRGRPYLDGITIYMIIDPSVSFAALRTKRLHMTSTGNGLTSSQAEIVNKEKLGIVAQRLEGSKTWRLLTRLDEPPWNDIKVRRAVDLVLDRQAAIRVVQEGMGTIGGPLPSNSPVAIPAAEVAKMPGYRQPKDADIAEAKRLLAEAGYPNGFDNRLLFRSGPLFEKAAVFFQDQLSKLGIRATLEGKEAAAYVSRLYEGQFALAALSLGIFAAEPGVILGDAYLTKGAQNYVGFSDREFDRMFDEQMRTMDVAKRKELLLKMQHRILEMVPFVLSHWIDDLMGLWPEVRDYKHGLTLYDNFQHENTWLAQ
ncbi:MAG: hypothetical protein HYX92_01135 [Chloroflexi bacterium]|nr:hypothetical protein [Chloroflexota bacterium]